MAWVKLSDDFYLNPKVARASLEARSLYVTGLCYAAHQMSDGFLAADLLPMLGGLAKVGGLLAVAAELVELGLWDPVEGGYQVRQVRCVNRPCQRRVHSAR